MYVCIYTKLDCDNVTPCFVLCVNTKKNTPDTLFSLFHDVFEHMTPIVRRWTFHFISAGKLKRRKLRVDINFVISKLL